MKTALKTLAASSAARLTSIAVPLISDTFTGVDNTALASHAPDINTTGNPWKLAIVANGLKISSNKAVVTLANSSNVEIINSGAADCILLASYVFAASDVPQLIFRYVDDNNYWQFYNATGTYTLREINAGTPTIRATLVETLTAGVSYRWQVVLNGNSIKCYVDGVLKCSFTSSLFATATQHGISLQKSAATFDDFKILQLAAPAIGFGDSVTLGVGASVANKNWLNLVFASMNGYYGAYLVNSGVSSTVLENTTQNTVAVIGGAASGNGQDTLAARVTAFSPRAVFVLYGLNDLRLNDAAFTTTTFQNSLTGVVNAIVAAGTPVTRIILGSPSYMDPAHYGDSSPYNAGTTPKHQAYRNAVAAVASALGTKYADIYQYMLDNGGNTLMSGDGIHPNDTGHAAIATKFLSVL